MYHVSTHTLYSYHYEMLAMLINLDLYMRVAFGCVNNFLLIESGLFVGYKLLPDVCTASLCQLGEESGSHPGMDLRHLK